MEQERAEDRGAEAQRDADLPWLVPEPFGAVPQSGWLETPTPPEGERAGFASPAAADAPVSSHRVRLEIAERLERIAAALRERDGLELGGDASDPLEVLITGYALGYSEGLQRGSRE